MLIFLTIAFALLYSSLIEYCLHRFALHHSPKQRHIVNHHQKFHGSKTYQSKYITPKDVISNKKYIFSNILPSIPFSLILFTINQGLGLLFIITSISYTLWVEYVHYFFHKGGNSLLEHLKFFQTLKEHHRIHHCIYNTNYGIASRLWDKVFKTKK